MGVFLGCIFGMYLWDVFLGCIHGAPTKQQSQLAKVTKFNPAATNKTSQKESSGEGVGRGGGAPFCDVLLVAAGLYLVTLANWLCCLVAAIQIFPPVPGVHLAFWLGPICPNYEKK